jgi:hypothetical protein
MFRVEWLQEALDELTNIWMREDSSVRKLITAAVHSLDQALAADPYRESESRDDEERVLFAYPLAVRVEVDLRRRAVWVLHVWRFQRRGE